MAIIIIMIIEGTELENLLFTIDDKNYEVEDIIKKYDLEKEKNSLIDSKENSFISIFDYIQKLYNENTPIPDDIKKLINEDLEFKSFFKEETSKLLNLFTSNSSTLFFEQLTNITNLLSLGEKYEVFEDYNSYSMDELSKLFREYEMKMGSTFEEESSENFNLTFELYTKLLDLLTNLCTVNALDLHRRKTIPYIIELVTESINILKFTILLDEEKLLILNNIQGQLMFRFAHINFVSTENKEYKFVLDEYMFLLERQISGFELCADSDFGNVKERKDEYFLHFLKNVSYLLLTMFNKIEKNFKDKTIDLEDSNIEEILHLYLKHCSFFNKEQKIEDIKHFKQILINNFAYLYTNPFDEISFSYSADSVINDFILQGSMNLNHKNLELIHHILTFYLEVEDKDLVTIALILTESKKINNDTLEFFKLKILDIILSKFVNYKANKEIDALIVKVVQYIEINKLASHLISMYSKLYLTISLYYSYLQGDKAIENSKKFYYIFVETNGLAVFEKEYKYIFEKLQYNFGKHYMNSLNIFNHNITTKEFQAIGLSNMHDYFKYKNLELKSKINAEISNLVNDILNKDGLDDKLITSKISHFLSQKLFFGLTVATIKNLNKPSKLLKGYEKFSMPLIGKFAIDFTYPKIYKETFNHIFKSNQAFIEQNIKNILVGYLKNRELYIDSVTKLENIHKLNKDILHRGDEQLTFMEVHLDNLQYVNTRFGFAAGDIYFKAIAQKINEKLMGGKIYRLSGVRLGVLLSINDSYIDMIDFLRSLSITMNDEEIVTTFSIGIAIDSKDRLLKKASLALNEAMQNEDRLSIRS